MTSPIVNATNEKLLRARKPSHIATQHKATASRTLLTQPTHKWNSHGDTPLVLPIWTAENMERRNIRNVNKSKGTLNCRHSAHQYPAMMSRPPRGVERRSSSSPLRRASKSSRPATQATSAAELSVNPRLIPFHMPAFESPNGLLHRRLSHGNPQLPTN